MGKMLLSFFCRIKVTGYCNFARLVSRRGGCCVSDLALGYVAADLAKHGNLCPTDTAGKQKEVIYPELGILGTALFPGCPQVQ